MILLLTSRSIFMPNFHPWPLRKPPTHQAPTPALASAPRRCTIHKNSDQRTRRTSSRYAGTVLPHARLVRSAQLTSSLPARNGLHAPLRAGCLSDQLALIGHDAGDHTSLSVVPANGSCRARCACCPRRDTLLATCCRTRLTGSRSAAESCTASSWTAAPTHTSCPR